MDQLLAALEVSRPWNGHGCAVWGALDVLGESACSSDSSQTQQGDKEQNLVVPALSLQDCLVGAAAAGSSGQGSDFGCAAGCPQCETKGAAGVQVSSWNCWNQSCCSAIPSWALLVLAWRVPSL